jgi:hypothetical protein
MIIVKLMGGLGNQMFQYAAAKSFALNNRAELLIDTSFLEDKSEKKNFTYRDFELNVFQLKDNVIDKFQLQLFLNKVNVFDNLRLNRLNQIFFNNKIPTPKIIRENILSPNKDIFNLISNNSLLEGYWQSEAYFISHQNIIRELFRFSNSIVNKKLLAEIINKNSVSVHIRRGDYANNDVINSVHGLCTIEYYIEAFQIMSSKIANPIFYIFSDDMNWTKNTLHFLNEKYNIVYIDQNNMNPSEDMNLMSNCKHNIIANSSFSWWGAWLNNKPEKIIISPSVWTKNNSSNPHLIPQTWIKI